MALILTLAVIGLPLRHAVYRVGKVAAYIKDIVKKHLTCQIIFLYLL